MEPNFFEYICSISGNIIIGLLFLLVAVFFIVSAF